MKSITIGIPTVNGPNRINNCLESIYKWNDIPSIVNSKGTLKHNYKVDVMILDDGSNRANVESMVFLSKFYNIPVLIHKENMGISKSWNDLANQGNSSIVVLLNDDILVSENWLTSMCYFLENNDNAGGVGWNFYFITEMDIPAILESEKSLMIDRDPFTKELRNEVMTIDEAIEQGLFQFTGQPGKVMCAVGSCFALKREVFELIDGGFCEEMLSFSEESLMFSQLSALGYPSYMLPEFVLYHEWSATFRTNPHLEASKRMIESRKIYCEKFDVPEEYADNPFEYTDPLIMGKLNKTLIKWIDRDFNEKEAII